VIRESTAPPPPGAIHTARAYASAGDAAPAESSEGAAAEDQS
jgi:hypothetical protein